MAPYKLAPLFRLQQQLKNKDIVVKRGASRASPLIIFSGFDLTQILFSAGDNMILQCFGEIYKIGTESRYPHDQISVLLRIFLRVDQGLLIDNIELGVGDVQLLPGLQITDEGLYLRRLHQKNQYRHV